MSITMTLLWDGIGLLPIINIRPMINICIIISARLRRYFLPFKQLCLNIVKLYVCICSSEIEN